MKVAVLGSGTEALAVAADVQRPMFWRRCLRPLPTTHPDAITEAWNIVGAAMYEAMGRLVTEPADEQR